MAEHEYNNPIILAFIGSLTRYDLARNGVRSSEMCKKHKYQLYDEENGSVSLQKLPDKAPKTKAQQKALTRWFLAVTLINNPILRQVRTCSQKMNDIMVDS